MAEGSRDIRSSASFLRQRWWALLASGVVALGFGAAYVTTVPAELVSTTIVLIAGGGSANEKDPDITTQAKLVTSGPVLAAAGRAVTPALSAEAVRQKVEVKTPSKQLIEIQASSIHGGEAQALSQAVAQAYVQALEERAKTVSGATVRQLQGRADLLGGQLKALQGQIAATKARADGEDPSSAAALQDAQLIARLSVNQSDIALKLNNVLDQIATAPTLSGASVTGSIVQPFSPATGPARYPRLIAWMAGGLIAGVLAAALALVIRLRRDPRLRARDDVADAIGTAVVADVKSRPQSSVAGWAALLGGYQAPAVDAWAFRQVLRVLAGQGPQSAALREGRRPSSRLEHPRSLILISIAGDRRGLAIGPQLAAFTASLGISTRLVLASGHDEAASLWAACASDRDSHLRPGLVVEARGDGLPLVRATDVPRDESGSLPEPLSALDAAPKHLRADLTVVLVVADPKKPLVPGDEESPPAVLALSPGTATREDLARIAVAADDVGVEIAGIVMADPDSSDRTRGRRTLDERARDVPLPVRMTGVSAVSVSGGNRWQGR